ncbi:MAG: hypothetical protein RL334_1207, partial [Chloroflexota bacterium]
ALVLYLGVFFFAPRGLLPRLVFVYFIGGAFSIDFCGGWHTSTFWCVACFGGVRWWWAQARWRT